MDPIKKLFFIPIGLPGMGKTTLARYLKTTTFNSLHPSKATLPFNINFRKISYDKMLTKHQSAYMAKYPDAEYHHVIDVIRGQAD